MNQHTANRIANAVKKVEGLVLHGKGRIYPPDADFPFKVWLRYDVVAGARVWYYAVCEIDPDIVATPTHVAGRIWEMDKYPIDADYQNWTYFTGSGYLFLDNTEYPPVFSYLDDITLLATGLPEDFIPIASFLVDGTDVTLFQIQYGDIFLSSGGSSVAPVQLTSKVTDEIYIGDVFQDGTDAAATETGVNIYVREIAAGETLRLGITFSAARQKQAGIYWWILQEVPRAI